MRVIWIKTVSFSSLLCRLILEPLYRFPSIRKPFLCPTTAKLLSPLKVCVYWGFDPRTIGCGSMKWLLVILQLFTASPAINIEMEKAFLPPPTKVNASLPFTNKLNLLLGTRPYKVIENVKIRKKR